MIANLKQSIGQYRSFMDYRYQAYKTELTQLLLQLKSFGLLFFSGVRLVSVGFDIATFFRPWKNYRQQRSTPIRCTNGFILFVTTKCDAQRNEVSN